ncbi:MAG: hypothetical protein WCX84_01800 [Syntrophales bacterium]|nr:hypothetical protein [Syntrophales bacterium]
MAWFVGGIISTILGLLGFVLWFDDFLVLLRGGNPVSASCRRCFSRLYRLR